jgi:hypothetical protein
VRFRPNDSCRFAELVAGLQAFALEVERGPAGEVFVRLDVPAHSTQPHMIATLRRQFVEVVRAALPDIGTRLADQSEGVFTTFRGVRDGATPGRMLGRQSRGSTNPQRRSNALTSSITRHLGESADRDRPPVEEADTAEE